MVQELTTRFFFNFYVATFKMKHFLDVTMYEPDADMIFNYLMVSALANASDIIEKKNLKATGGN